MICRFPMEMLIFTLTFVQYVVLQQVNVITLNNMVQPPRRKKLTIKLNKKTNGSQIIVLFTFLFTHFLEANLTEPS